MEQVCHSIDTTRNGPHVAIARECRDEIEKEIRKSTSKEADKIANSILAEYANKEVLLDIKTENGRKDGVQFP